MKQAEDRVTVDWCEDDDQDTWPRRCTLYCRACKTTARGVLVQRMEGPPPCSRCGELRPGIIEEVPAVLVATETGKDRKTRGAYRGAVKIGADNQAARARTKLSQAEFAALAGVSERTLRTWERGDEVSLASDRKICLKLGELLGPTRQTARPLRYRDPLTGDTWSGRGLQPAWLKAKLDNGARLDDFELGAPDPHRGAINAAAQRAARSAGLA